MDLFDVLVNWLGEDTVSWLLVLTNLSKTMGYLISGAMAALPLTVASAILSV
jgi:hypothetical protein